MPKNSKTITLEDVLKFFVEDIDGTGQQDGHPRNEMLPQTLSLFTKWTFRELTEDEFWKLIISDDKKKLLKDKDIADVEGEDSIFIMEKYTQMLDEGAIVPPLIVRSPLSGDTEGASYYIEDGNHKALGHKIHFQNNPYKPVKAYIGTR